MALHAILYADDVVLMAASRDHMLQTLQELKQVPSRMGLHLALDKCQFICSPGLDSTPLLLPDVTESLAIKHTEAVMHLGRFWPQLWDRDLEALGLSHWRLLGP